MALIGEMKYLTIGDSTYEIPEYELPIASASTLGGIKIGSGLSIDSSTGIVTAQSSGGTVTSVRVQATSPVQSSTSTAQTSTLNTTISLANGYGDTKNPYGTKTAHYVLAGPTSGSATAPSFRALVASDIPDLSDTYLTSYTDTTYSAGTGLSLSGTTFNHENSITAGTVGETAATSGASISIPYIIYDSEGHISVTGTRTHTVSGFAAASHSHGDISSGGDITTTTTIASGDRLVISDESAGKITNSSITFGTSTTTYLRNDGTWGEPGSGSGQILSGTSVPASTLGNDGDIYILLDGTSVGSLVYSVVSE